MLCCFSLFGFLFLFFCFQLFEFLSSPIACLRAVAKGSGRRRPVYLPLGMAGRVGSLVFYQEKK
jgi:hypothetical protein